MTHGFLDAIFPLEIQSIQEVCRRNFNGKAIEYKRFIKYYDMLVKLGIDKQ